jgi:hypothetical protein
MYDKIVLFVYGGDNYDSRYLESVKISSVTLGDQDLRDQYLFDRKLLTKSQKGGKDSKGKKPAKDVEGPKGDKLPKGDKSSDVDIFEEEFNRILEDREFYRKNTFQIENLTKAFPFKEKQKLPVNIKRLIRDIIYDYGRPEKRPTLNQLTEMMKTVADFCEIIPTLALGEMYSPPPEYHVKTTFLLIMSIRLELCSRVLYEKLNKEYLDLILDKIRLSYTNAIIDYGNPVGISSAEYFGERQTQYMLDSHHRSVSGGTDKSGVQKIGNILSAKLAPDSSMIIWPHSEYEDDLSYVQEAANNIEMMKFKVFSHYKIFFEAYKNINHPKYKSENNTVIGQFENRHPLIKPPKNLLHWCIRYKLNKFQLVLKSMELETIIERLRRTYPKLFIVHSSELDEKIIIRIYIQSDMKGAKNDKKYIIDLAKTIWETNIRGISGVIRAEVQKFIKHEEKEDGSVERKDCYAISTIGTNLEDVIGSKHVDPLRCLSDSVMDTYKMYGIVAARQRIKYELTVGLGDDAPDERNISLIAANMTFTGQVTSMEYSSILLRTPGNILHKMSSGYPLQTLEAAVNKGVYNKIKGLSAALCVGQMPKYGTQAFNVYVDETKIQDVKTLSEELDEL